jgi:TetR/AcrR family transcriptional repressor of nem operon
MAIFRSITNPSQCPQGRYGCFMVNSALELAPSDKDVAKATSECFREIAAFFASLVRKGQKRGEIGSACPAAETGRALMSQLLGLMVLVRSGAPWSTIDSVNRQVDGLLK